jgi:eukaryotic-like serine/threonine-protein kinase
VFLLDGEWSLADFGISRYAEAATGTDTRKYMQTDPYAAPERWRHEHATSAVDVYSLGVIAFEMLQGQRPFHGPDFRHQHLHEDPPELQGVPLAPAALVDECLLKAPQGRPSAANTLVRLGRAATSFSTPGLARLQEANRAEVGRRAEAARQHSVAQTDAERRSELFRAAERSFRPISAMLREAIEERLRLAVRR